MFDGLHSRVVGSGRLKYNCFAAWARRCCKTLSDNKRIVPQGGYPESNCAKEIALLNGVAEPSHEPSPDLCSMLSSIRNDPTDADEGFPWPERNFTPPAYIHHPEHQKKRDSTLGRNEAGARTSDVEGDIFDKTK